MPVRRACSTNGCIRSPRSSPRGTATNPDAPSAPFAVNQIVHRSNDRLEADVHTCAKWKVPIVITSLGARPELNDAVHSWGGITLHDVIDDRFAHKAIEKGADGLILVATGAGGHAGVLNPFAFVQEVREWFGGPLILSGAIATGRAVLAAQVARRRPRIYRLAVHRHRRGQCRPGLQAGHRRGPGGRHHLFEPLHRGSRQLPAQLDHCVRAGPRQICPKAIPAR